MESEKPSLEQRIEKLEDTVRFWRAITIGLVVVLLLFPTGLGQVVVGVLYVAILGLMIAAAVFALIYAVMWVCDFFTPSQSTPPEGSK
jgi:hypothetical protein